MCVTSFLVALITMFSTLLYDAKVKYTKLFGKRAKIKVRELSFLLTASMTNTFLKTRFFFLPVVFYFYFFNTSRFSACTHTINTMGTRRIRFDSKYRKHIFYYIYLHLVKLRMYYAEKHMKMLAGIGENQ